MVSNVEYAEANELLSQAVENAPDDPELNCELGILYCYLQKEFEAVPHLEKSVGAERHPILAELLRDYLFCRNQLAVKLNVADEKGEQLRSIVAKHIQGQPEGIGIKLSACLIVKNEEKQLERCLRSVQPIVDEIVVVDTGSTDRTLEIAEKYGAVIGHFEWCDDFAAARNESLRLATGNWALWIDADEELDPESFTQIREAVMRPQFAGYYMKIVNFMDEKVAANTYVHTAVRLFRKIEGIGFTGRIHEQIVNGFKEKGYIPATLTKGVINHYGYQAAVMNEKKKIERTISMLKKEVEEAPQEPFHWFNLANAYSVAAMTSEAESAGRKCVELIDVDAPYGPAVFQIVASSLVSLHRSEEALPFCELAVEKGYDTVLNEFERAHAYLDLRRYEEGLQAIDRCIAMDWPISLTGDYAIKSYKALVLKAQILCGLERFEEAEELVNQGLAKHPGFPMALFALAQIREKTGKIDEAYQLYLQASHGSGMGASCKLAGRVALDHGKFMEAALAFEQYWQQCPADVDSWIGWARACTEIGDMDGLIRACEQIGEDRIPSADFLINWGRALEAKGDKDAALKKFAAAVQRSPANPNAYFNCGDLLYKMGYYQEAAGIYELGLQRDPSYAQGWFVLGNCFAQMGLIEGAETSYNQAIQLQPGHEGATHNLAQIKMAA